MRQPRYLALLIRILILFLTQMPLVAFAAPADLIPILETLVQLNAAEARSPATTITRLTPGPTLKLGSSGERVRQLNVRLAELGYATQGKHFDADTDAAVRRYQSALGIAEDGLVDEHTRFNLNLSNREKIALLRAQFDEMERLFAQHADDRFVLVNIPAFSLRAFDKGNKALESRVVIGSPARPTPLMTTSLTGIVLNPPWAPPPTILAKDIFKSGEIDSRAVARLGLKLIDPHGQSASLDHVTTRDDLAAGDYRLVQPPGEKNALGQLKFDLDNPLGIYLHDTNHRDLFNKGFRALSSGCVRVDRFRELAAWMLGEDTADIERELRDHRTRRLDVERMPVVIVYWQAEAEGDKVVFYRDIYDRRSSTKKGL